MPESLLDILESMVVPKLSDYEKREMDKIMNHVIAILARVHDGHEFG